MKFCPRCGSEYHDDIVSCTDCDSSLVGPAEWDAICRKREHEAAEEFVTVKTVADQFAADVVRQALEQEGLPVLVRSFTDTSFDGIFVPQKGWGMILVPREFLSRATEIIASLE